MKYPVEFRSPSGDYVLVIPRVEESRNGVALTVFDDLSLDLRDGSETNGSVGEPSKMWAAGLTHVVN